MTNPISPAQQVISKQKIPKKLAGVRVNVEQVRRRNTGTGVAVGFVEMEKADPVIMAITRGYTIAIAVVADGLATVEFHAAAWMSAIQFDYRDGHLSETGPLPLL